jgi:hypothetical protein
MSATTNDLINSIATGNMVDAKNAFTSIMQSRIDDALESEKVRVGQSITGMDEEFDLSDYSLEELEDFMVSEDYESIDELSKKTLGSYVKKARSDKSMRGSEEESYREFGGAGGPGHKAVKQQIAKRTAGINRASTKLNKEDFDNTDD